MSNVLQNQVLILNAFFTFKGSPFSITCNQELTALQSGTQEMESMPKKKTKGKKVILTNSFIITRHSILVMLICLIHETSLAFGDWFIDS